MFYHKRSLCSLMVTGSNPGQLLIFRYILDCTILQNGRPHDKVSIKLGIPSASYWHPFQLLVLEQKWRMAPWLPSGHPGPLLSVPDIRGYGFRSDGKGTDRTMIWTNLQKLQGLKLMNCGYVVTTYILSIVGGFRVGFLTVIFHLLFKN